MQNHRNKTHNSQTIRIKSPIIVKLKSLTKSHNSQTPNNLGITYDKRTQITHKSLSKRVKLTFSL